MNIWALPSLVAGFIILVLGIYIIYKNPKHALNRIFSIFAFLWAIIELSTGGYLAALNIGMVKLFGAITIVCYCFLFALLLHFILIFSKKDKLLRKPVTYLLLYLPSLVFSYIMLTTDLLFILAPIKKYWGYTFPTGDFFWIFLIYYFIFLGIAIYFVGQVIKIGNHIERKQAAIIISSLILFLIFESFAEGISPGIKVEPYEGIRSIFSVISVSLIAFAILKYKLFIVTPASGFAKKTEYTSFLNKLLSETSKKDHSDFNRYLKETGMGKIASFRDGNIETHFEKMGSLNLFDVCEKTMEYMEKDYENLAEDFLPVMNNMYSRLTHVSDETDKIFTSIIKKHENFLTKTGIIYGFADGKFLSVIKEDVLPEDDADAFLKVYRRIFLSITGSINTLGADRFRIISAGGEYTGMLSVQNGVVSMDGAVKKLRVLQREARITKLRDGFNLLLNIIYKELPEKDAKKTLESIGFVFKLNKKAVGLGVCPNILFEIICNELPMKNKIKTCFPNAEYKNALLRMNAEILSYKELVEKTNMLVPLFGKEKVTEISEKYGVGL